MKRLRRLPGRPRVARVMLAEGIRGDVNERKVRTTIPEPSDTSTPDLVKRDFTAEAPMRRSAEAAVRRDSAYLPIADGMPLYFAIVIGCSSRRLGA